MKKKTYKQMQNRLYREIKRRIIAEQVSKFLVPVIERNDARIETLEIRNIVPKFLAQQTEFVKTDMANKIASKLVANGFVEFYSSSGPFYSPMENVMEIRARVKVVKPLPQNESKGEANDIRTMMEYPPYSLW